MELPSSLYVVEIVTFEKLPAYLNALSTKLPIATATLMASKGKDSFSSAREKESFATST